MYFCVVFKISILQQQFATLFTSRRNYLFFVIVKDSVNSYTKLLNAKETRKVEEHHLALSMDFFFFKNAPERDTWKKKH